MAKLIVTSSPHITSTVTTRKLMGNVCIALLPALIASAILYGARTLLLVGVTAAACVGFEALWNIITKKEQTVGDLSAVVTGILLAFNVPPSFPLWMAIIGAFVAIIVVKQMFGGIGCNFANPAIVARIVLSLSFAGEMTTYNYLKYTNGISAFASATPLAVDSSTFWSVPYKELLLGVYGGVLGETCSIALIAGGIYLIATRTISATIPVSYLATVALMSWACGQNPLYQLLTGGLLLGAFFMATDYVTCPFTETGKLIFGVGLGLITCLIRFFGTSPEGVSYAILLMNILVPYINIWSRQRPLGVHRAKKEKPAKAGPAAKEAN